MERLVTVKDVCERYGVTLPTARKYLRQVVPHMEKPLSAPLWAFREWEEARTVIPATVSRKRKIELLNRTKAGRIRVPRKREE